MFTSFKRIGGKWRLPEKYLAIKADLKNDKRQPLRDEQDLSRDDRSLLQSIRFQTERLNSNNKTRTKAYLDFYSLHPEIHWAFLGHMVSRNGGWNMTDLNGEFLSKLMQKQTKRDFFSFLERGNWLIFQDAYPQFLLYAESKSRNRNLFYLLPYLHVSRFMEVIWNHFWRERDCYLLAIALVINEQNYLENRIIQNPLYKKNVFQTLEFVLQDFLSVNHILFPYHDHREPEGRASLIGLTLHHFGSLHERIMLGKRLYQLLFGERDLFEAVYRWAIAHPHTGSRKDYWPEVFNDLNEGVPGASLSRRIKSCQIKKGALRLFSPKLEYAWKNVNHTEAEQGDWYEHWYMIEYLREEKIAVKGKIEGEYCETLEKLELAAIAKTTIFP
ncbi:DUF2515 domain-containing protein [Sporosarcina sp. ACRSM]|uniref:DUF2515 domain-containing protein n=1 Tax=Sporosarcina sp. ACRSM TaxID=2918216 RepID=UPI001EF6C31C|nr:DUF2515 domain-containing protein [Sporosarcina sp. ACRSM]MCG7334673.1 DUF2515 domain-containing protein [Sporosarcina sp. ACRSM]